MTTLIQPRKNGADISKLTVKQQKFVMEVLATDSFDVAEAAKRAGYKSPPQAATKLMKNKAIARALGKAMRERGERCQLKADDVLNYLKEALYFDPYDYFEPAPGGGWLVEDASALPKVVRQLIDQVDKIELPDENGEMEWWDVIKSFIPKPTALVLALKHTVVDKSEITGTLQINWDTLLSTSKNGKPKNSKLIEQTILDVESTES